MKVFILATARNPELLSYTTLVFNTIRVGFPSAEIFVQGNALPEFALKAVMDKCKLSGCEFKNDLETIHHDWINKLLSTQTEEFWICDTDMIFYNPVENYPLKGFPLAGRRIPEFHDEFSGCLTRSRLHTSLLLVNPLEVKKRVEVFTNRVAQTPFTPISNLINPIVVPFKGKGVFYDTCSQLYHAVGGHQFSDDILDSYFHMNFGTISDIVLPRLNGSGEAMQKARNAIMENPSLGRGVWRHQEQYYMARQQ